MKRFIIQSTSNKFFYSARGMGSQPNNAYLYTQRQLDADPVLKEYEECGFIKIIPVEVL